MAVKIGHAVMDEDGAFTRDGESVLTFEKLAASETDEEPAE